MRDRVRRRLALGLALAAGALAAGALAAGALAAGALTAGALTAGAVGAQSSHPSRGDSRGVTARTDGEVRSVRGRVVRGGESSARPLAGAWVVLHRVGSDRAAPLDSVRTDAAGRYAFRYRASGDAKALYFVSSTYGGIAYFTSPLRTRTVSGEDAELVAYDTTSAPVSIHVRAWHVVVSAPDSSATRTVVEIFELSNDSSVTRVARGDTGVVWESILLEGARDARIGQTDFSPEAVRFVDGRARLFAPFAPGLKQVSFSYTLPAAARDFDLFVATSADVLEVLVEDPLARVEGGGVVTAGPTTVSGRTYARFLGQDLGANAVVRVHAPGRRPASDTQLRVFVIVAALGTALLVGLARAMMRRPLGAARPSGRGDVAELRAQLAALDESYVNIGDPDADQRADHWQKRAHLTQQLTNALAREQGLA